MSHKGGGSRKVTTQTSTQHHQTRPKPASHKDHVILVYSVIINLPVMAASMASMPQLLAILDQYTAFIAVGAAAFVAGTALIHIWMIREDG